MYSYFGDEQLANYVNSKEIWTPKKRRKGLIHIRKKNWNDRHEKGSAVGTVWKSSLLATRQSKTLEKPHTHEVTPSVTLFQNQNLSGRFYWENSTSKMEVVVASSSVEAGIACWDLNTGAELLRYKSCASPPHGLVCVGERFLASSQLRDSTGSVKYWAWSKVNSVWWIVSIDN